MPADQGGTAHFLRKYLAFFWLSACFPALANAQPDCAVVARASSIQGSVDSRATHESTWQPVRQGHSFCTGDLVRVGENSRATLVLPNDTLVRLDQLTTLSFTGGQPQQGNPWARLVQGIAHFVSRVQQRFEVATPFVNAAIEGTEFVVDVDPARTQVTVFEGRVRAANAHGHIDLGPGERAQARAGQAPVLTTVLRPRDAVQWSLHYPAVFNQQDLADQVAQLSPAWRAKVQRSLELADTGAHQQAVAELAGLPAHQADFLTVYIYRAALLLNLGRLDKARQDLTQALALQPRNADALALQSIIALAQNDKTTAAELAHQARAAEPGNAAAALAQSYSQQAAFDVEGARASLQDLVQHHPQNALAWARLAELHLMTGDLDAAVHAAQRATALKPRLAHSHSVLGFAYLARIDGARARQAFEHALDSNPNEPLAQLGLGLATIRAGHLAEGRRHIELAASLNPNHALTRSYLGKAYFEERRNALAAAQFALAKELDPKDPTPYFYDALRKQAENRPVDALEDFNRAMALNKNRAVYRSTLLLDSTEADYGAGLARIYEQLGFQQRALLEGWQSVHVDPGNASAHRFLSDSYVQRPRHEVTRASALLKSQLLQTGSAAPQQARLSETSFALAEGPGTSFTGYNEFNPLFKADGIGLRFDSVDASHATGGRDLTVYGTRGPLFLSLNALHFESQGYRANNDYDQDIYDIYAQYAPSPKSNTQIELRRNRLIHGDIVSRFDRTAFFTADRSRRDVETARLGHRYSPAPGSHILGFVAYEERDEFKHTERTTAIVNTSDATSDAEGYAAELQHIYTRDDTSLVYGVGHSKAEGSLRAPFQLTTLGGFVIQEGVITDDLGFTHENAYMYWHQPLSKQFRATLGFSWDRFSNSERKRDQINPKLGLLWNPRPDTLVRAAAFRTLKRPIISQQTIEPAQVAGFNQLFDVFNATDTRHYGLGLDRRWSSALSTGLEFNYRELDIPLPNQRTRKDKEIDNLAYLYWAPTKQIALSTAVRFDRSYRAIGAGDFTQPRLLRTWHAPTRLTYFYNRALALRLEAHYVHQTAEFNLVSNLFSRAHDDFWTSNISLDYRLPRRRGLLSIGVDNLFDEEFGFEDNNFRNNTVIRPGFIPERTIFTRFSLSF